MVVHSPYRSQNVQERNIKTWAHSAWEDLITNSRLDRNVKHQMTQKMATVTSTPEVHLPDAPSGGSSTTLGVYK